MRRCILSIGANTVFDIAALIPATTRSSPKLMVEGATALVSAAITGSGANII
jgi:hypothetical protein